MYHTGTLGDERYLVLECPELLCFREQWSHLFEGPQTMQAFMWQEDLKILVLPDLSTLACIRPLRVKHLISLVWLEEM